MISQLLSGLSVLGLLSVAVSPGALAQPARVKVEPQRLAPFVTSPQPIIEHMLSAAGLKSDDTLYDLGCGDGRILITAAKKFGARAVGVEMSSILVKRALAEALSQGVGDKVKVIEADLRNVDVSAAQVVALYLMTEANDLIQPKLERELRPGARVVSLDFKFRNWKPAKVEKVVASHHNYTIYVYEMPQK